MQVFIMRHGEAVLDAVNDVIRPLTFCGCDESRQIASWLNTQPIDIERVLVSPYFRAKETLQVVREIMILPKADVLVELNPIGNPKYIIDYLYTLVREEVSGVLLISHLPLIYHLVNTLCLEKNTIMFVTSSVTNISLETNVYGKFKWYVSPSQIVVKF